MDVECIIKKVDKVWKLRVCCPFCHKSHSHGGGYIADGPPNLGHRFSHCKDFLSRDSYTLVATKLTEGPEASDRKHDE